MRPNNPDPGPPQPENEETLRLEKDGAVLFSSRKHGIKPLVECLAEFCGKIEDGIITDKVVGTAAARLIGASGICVRVRTGLISKSARRRLEESGIGVEARREADFIRGKDNNGPCPMEDLSGDHCDDSTFFQILFNRFSLPVPDRLK